MNNFIRRNKFVYLRHLISILHRHNEALSLVLVVVIFVVIVVLVEDFLEDFFSLVIIFFSAFSRFFRPVCNGGNQPDARADQCANRRAVLLPFDPLAAFFGVFVIVINDPCYRSGEAVDSTDDAS